MAWEGKGAILDRLAAKPSNDRRGQQQRQEPNKAFEEQKGERQDEGNIVAATYTRSATHPQPEATYKGRRDRNGTEAI
jgi:hypothetical protein